MRYILISVGFTLSVVSCGFYAIFVGPAILSHGSLISLFAGLVGMFCSLLPAVALSKIWKDTNAALEKARDSLSYKELANSIISICGVKLLVGIVIYQPPHIEYFLEIGGVVSGSILLWFLVLEITYWIAVLLSGKYKRLEQ